MEKQEFCKECDRPLRPGCCDGEPPYEVHIDPTRAQVFVSYLDSEKRPKLSIDNLFSKKNKEERS